MNPPSAGAASRAFARPLGLAVLAAALLGLGAWSYEAASTTIVVVVRHADKARDGTVDPPLSPTGIERAERLAGILAAGERYRVDAIFVSQYRRSLATAQPLAVASGIPIIHTWADDVGGLATRIDREFRGKRVLVVAHSDTIPQIVDTLGEANDIPAIAPAEYGTTYVVAIPRFGRPNVLRLMLP